jgi:hypothetical protein
MIEVKDLRRFATSENALARSWPEQYCFLSVTRASPACNAVTGILGGQVTL